MYRLVDLAEHGRTLVSSLLVSHAEELLSVFTFVCFSFQAYQKEPSHSAISSKDFMTSFMLLSSYAWQGLKVKCCHRRILQWVQTTNTQVSCQLSATPLEVCICIPFVERQECNVDSVFFII